MLAALALVAIQISAQVSYDKDGHATKLTVRKGGKTYIAASIYHSEPKLPLTEKLRFYGAEITGEYATLFNKKEGKALDVGPISRKLFPHVPEKYDSGMALRSKGGLSLGKTALWVFSWDLPDVMSEPSGETFAVEFHLAADGAPVVDRSAVLTGLGPHLLGTRAIRFGDRLALVASGISIFDLKTWKEVKAMDEDDGQGCIADGKRLYWAQHGWIFIYEPAQNQFFLKGEPDLGDLVDAIPVDGEDVLIFTHGVFTPVTRATYRFPGPSNTGGPQEMFVIPGIGFAFLDVYAFPASTPGIVLSSHYLAPMALIKKRPWDRRL